VPKLTLWLSEHITPCRQVTSDKWQVATIYLNIFIRPYQHIDMDPSLPSLRTKSWCNHNIAICSVGIVRSCYRFDGLIRYLWTSLQTMGNTITVYGRRYTRAWTKRLTSGPRTVAFANRFSGSPVVRHAVRPCRRLVVVV